MTPSDKIGTRICTFRERLGMTVEDLAKNAGVDVNLIRRAEAGEVYPPLGVMVKISRALGQRLGTFMDDQVREDPIIVRAVDRIEETAAHKDGAEGHYHYYPLGKGKTDRHMDPLFIVIQPNQDRQTSSHEGEELVIVVKGEVELIYGRETFLLSTGDSMYYNSIVPHHLGAANGENAEIYAVVYTPF
ncbi:MAG: cupin domain-containing protein [Methanomassiliicoccales archaeon]|nr:cupin domain-containing protein [Methanomassiliicoccales archaeon]